MYLIFNLPRRYVILPAASTDTETITTNKKSNKTQIDWSTKKIYLEYAQQIVETKIQIEHTPQRYEILRSFYPSSKKSSFLPIVKPFKKRNESKQINRFFLEHICSKR